MSLSLTANNHILEVVTTQALALDVTASFRDLVTGTTTPGSQTTAITTATTTTVVAAPAASTQRQIDDVEIVNKGAGVQTVTVQKTVGVTPFVIFGPVSLLQNERVHFTADRGWRAFTTSGAEKTGLNGNILLTNSVSSVQATSLQFSNANNFSWLLSTGASAATLSGSFQPGVSAISAGASNITAGGIVFSNSNNVSFGFNGSTVTASAAVPTLIHWNNFAPEVSAVLGATADSMWLFPLPYDEVFPGAMTLNTLNLGLSCSMSTATGSSYGSTFRIGLYTLNNSTQLSLLNSVSSSFSQTATSNMSLFIQGPKFLTLHSSQWSVQPVLGQSHYWMGIILNTAGLSTQISRSFQAASVGRSQVSGVFGNSNTGGHEFYPFHGAVSTAGIPSAIAASAVIGSHSYGHMIPTLQFLNGVQTA